MDDLQLVELSKSGDSRAFGSLIDRYYRNIYRFAYQYIGNYHDADEVCQETFLRAFENIKKVRDGNSFRGWIFTIAINLLHKRAKRGGREKMLDSECLEAAADNFSDKRGEPAVNLYIEEKIFIVNQQLIKMPEQMRAVTVLVLMEGISQKDVSQILKCSEASVSRILNAARERLKEKLKSLI